MHPQATPTRLPRWGPRRQRRCSSFKYSRYSQLSRLAGGAPRSSRCDARLSPRAAKVVGSQRRSAVACDRVRLARARSARARAVGMRSAVAHQDGPGVLSQPRARRQGDGIPAPLVVVSLRSDALSERAPSPVSRMPPRPSCRAVQRPWHTTRWMRRQSPGRDPGTSGARWCHPWDCLGDPAAVPARR